MNNPTTPQENKAVEDSLEPEQVSIDSTQEQEQHNNQSSTDWSSGIDPIDLVELVVELGKDALDVVGGALENIDISF